MPVDSPETAIWAEKLKEMNTGETLAEFRKFPQLPPELRQIVWCAHCAMNGRIVELGMTQSNSFNWRFVTTARVPAVLHVSHEARYEALLKYKLSFPVDMWGLVLVQPRIYFNYSVDTLYLNSDIAGIRPWLKRWVPCDDMEAVKSLVTNTPDFDPWVPRDRFLIKTLNLINFRHDPDNSFILDLQKFRGLFPELERLDLVYQEYTPNRGIAMMEFLPPAAPEARSWMSQPRHVPVQTFNSVSRVDPRLDPVKTRRRIANATSSWPSGRKPEIRVVRNIGEVAETLNIRV